MTAFDTLSQIHEWYIFKHDEISKAWDEFRLKANEQTLTIIQSLLESQQLVI
ncbi:hypothetical protein Glove_170g37 [Diversispora epigaea]|uniref:Uncharacterized protein n=1 Tax=Diversispora epigaea TaxID=1348612 RepID=A0A397IPJ5_9GLOM|nr:hypothetical protein Glove_170g37 [Diversispora epigaea]